MISDLPDAETLDRQDMQGLNPYGMHSENLNKYIRNNHMPVSNNHWSQAESGMLGNLDRAGYGRSFGNSHHATLSDMDEMMAYGQPPIPPQHQSILINCIDIAKHVQDCPICSRFYNNDKTTYVITIVVLSIVCLLLLKKILNV
jgi:hypothetical protein